LVFYSLELRDSGTSSNKP